MISYIDTKIIQKLNKATPFRSVFPIPSIKNIFQEIYINENLKYIIEMKSHTVEFYQYLLHPTPAIIFI